MNDTIKKAVRNHYAAIAKTTSPCCAPAVSACGCCGPSREPISLQIGYTEQDLKTVPEGADLGLGCGNPVALASLKKGEVVVDLGSGAGFDCFLAARKVGPEGLVIGVDMTDEMLFKARENARKGGFANVEFRLGEIEHLPVADRSADAVISNCVINLSTDKPGVFKEALRVLKPGGRLMVSDLVLLRPLPETIRHSLKAYAECIAGAWLKEEYLAAISDAGFGDVTVEGEAVYPIVPSRPDASDTASPVLSKVFPEDLRAAAEAIVSLKVRALKPIGPA